MAKLVWVDDGEVPKYQNVLAYVGSAPSCRVLPPGATYFTEDQTLALKQRIESYFDEVIESIPLYGLVLTGGKSTRMGLDKAALDYHGRPQVRHCFDLLSALCDKVFVSLRSEQSGEATYRDFPQIHDTFLGYGPLGGILSAQKAHPHAAWLVLACDLPAVTPDTLEYLCAERNPFKLATAYTSANDGFPEPLCAIYEPKSIFRLMSFLALGYHCPRKVLINSDTWLIRLPDVHALDNANSPDEREALLESISKHAGTP
ncbi:MAG: NTP transferase domain-containing protein [Candidatus Hydrogenedentes bacterium]|nr:NTP transferase domain-containing protein [Candidatus Hydrogenedentota bacterium]